MHAHHSTRRWNQIFVYHRYISAFDQPVDVGPVNPRAGKHCLNGHVYKGGGSEGQLGQFAANPVGVLLLVILQVRPIAANLSVCTVSPSNANEQLRQAIDGAVDMTNEADFSDIDTDADTACDDSTDDESDDDNDGEFDDYDDAAEMVNGNTVAQSTIDRCREEYQRIRDGHIRRSPPDPIAVSACVRTAFPRQIHFMCRK
ncbi:unnamed protein product (mitochondrion) [Plasmodiophora brassicae]|uniref:Uncharacterized protein n=1 Tax=Plasmodiophora brassicae TaxID=37360 RepID=A0A3P3YHB0_PLABS|nr:unnamed protein product [Plasmodiophora brassicae]